jgi:hypothetical protein
MRLFDRCARVIVHRQDTTDLTERRDNWLSITDLRMAFEVKKSVDKEPNTATLTINNCNARTRADLQQQPLTVQIEAGYAGVYRSLFLGNLRYGTSAVEGPQWETKLELVDGGRGYTRGRISRSYNSGTELRTVLRDAAKSMGLAIPQELLSAPDLSAQIAAGVSVTGVSRDTLTKLLAPLNYNWSIQDGKLQVLRADQTRDEVWLINEENGLIGSPEYSAPEKKSKKNKGRTLTFSTLLFPELTPGSKVKVESRAVNGLHKIKSIQHTGDTHGSDWTTEVEATPL